MDCPESTNNGAARRIHPAGRRGTSWMADAFRPVHVRARELTLPFRGGG